MRVAIVSGAATIVLAALSFLSQFCGTAFAAHDCGPTGVTCLIVGESASIRVTSGLLGLQCYYPNLQKDHELITLHSRVQPPTVTGRPKVIFNSPTIKAWEVGTLATVQTTENTRPGQYTVSLLGTGADCGSYPGFTWYFWVVPKITGGNQVWSFGGPEPAGYPAEITLTALPANRPPYKWDLTYGQQFLRFPNGKAYITTLTNTVKVHGIKPWDGQGLTQAAVSVGDGGLLSFGHLVKVRAPKSLEIQGLRQRADTNRGYTSTAIYVLVDQVGQDIRGPAIPVNIVWNSSFKHDFIANTNWVREQTGRQFAVDPHDFRFNIFPRTSGDHPAVDGKPKAQAPHGGAVKVDCWDVSVYVGSKEFREGIKVDTQTWLRYADHATPEANCPD